MIGVVANPSDHAVVSEFFQLFKTPWEFCRSGQRYEALLCAGDCSLDENNAPLILLYSGRECPFDAKNEIQIASLAKGNRIFGYKGIRIPIYGDSVTFKEKGTNVVLDQEPNQSAIYRLQPNGREVVRIGYDLFKEVRCLLTAGQPTANAAIPTLDLHIALLRDLIVARGVPLIEIPPVPEGYQFIACLTHDVDHPSIRRHKFDHTAFGFLYRAVFGSVFDVLRGRRSMRQLLTNWTAALKLPFIYIGLAKDFWGGFIDYTKLESGLGSSFFVIPFKGRPGLGKLGTAPSQRATQYGAVDIAAQILKLKSEGCEIGLHGIDAWTDSSRGHEELAQIRQLTDQQNIGVRMHWLYFDKESPVTLEKAGADYDSTFGYNETIGYRAGTAQAYKPLEATTLLELPLHIMDTALFYPSYLNLSSTEASERVSHIIDHASKFGGCVTVNWHDRSIAPERIWCDFYLQLIDDLKIKGAWFPTASQAVSWFRKRRFAMFQDGMLELDALHVKISVDENENLPGLCLRIHNFPEPRQAAANGVPSTYFRDFSLTHSINTRFAFPSTLGTKLLPQ